MRRELAPRVNPKDYEKEMYDFWLSLNLFHADENSTKEPYSIVIPPPNITGSLHIGHALNITLQDILIRYHKLKGFETMWIPGTDHAGIATQNVVEKQLASKGISRLDMGQDKFVEAVWKWKDESGSAIMNQLKALGASFDWQRESFTMNDELSKAVRKVFVTLYNEGLIYRANRMGNRCVHCHTALSDLEVEFEDKSGFLYTIRYMLSDGTGYVDIATTRPETYLGDSAVAVNPNDSRHKHLIGKNVVLPILNKEIPIIGDEYVDMEYGTGFLKVTPAHDPNDFEIAQRHNLDYISVISESGEITVAPFSGLTVDEGRKDILKALDSLGLLVAKEPITHSVGHCYRCSSVIEPLVSLQWFVKIKPLADKAIKAVKEKDINIVPKMWENSYFEWMYNIRDWSISRQIWWGHRIPAWHCSKCGHITVAEENPSNCERCSSVDIHQETDVLDTWFSSALWPFSTMGWPNETETLKKFYPTSVLVTGFDIIFFWVARMIMMGIKFMDEIPFKDVYLHAIVRDEKGEKMSKTRGNVINPLDVIDKYGADALRFSLSIFAAQGRDIKLSENKIEGYRNFINKIWNASRFIFMNLDDNIPKISISDLKYEDKWILTKLADVITNVEMHIKSYDFNEAASTLYNFFWMIFCDWYVELIKERLYSGVDKQSALATSAYVLEKALIVMHPFMPFVTEHIWQHLVASKDKDISILNCSYPSVEYSFPTEARDMDKILDIINNIRNIRGEYNVNPGVQLQAYFSTDNDTLKLLIDSNIELIKKMGRLSSFTLVTASPDNVASQVSVDYSVYIPLEGMVDIKSEILKFEKELKSLEKDYKLYSGKLSNTGYLSKASPEVIEKDRNKVIALESQIDKVKKALEQLNS